MLDRYVFHAGEVGWSLKEQGRRFIEVVVVVVVVTVKTGATRTIVDRMGKGMIAAVSLRIAIDSIKRATHGSSSSRASASSCVFGSW